MTKSEKLTLEAWNIWLIQNQLSTVNSDVNLRLSVLGQAFTGGWEAAIHSVMTQLSGFVEQTNEIENVEATNTGNVPFTVRAYNCLRAEGIETIGDLLKYSERDLCRIPNMGRKSIKDIKEVLASMNLLLRQSKQSVREGSLDSAPVKKKVPRPSSWSSVEQRTAYINDCRKRRLAIYYAWKYAGKTVRELAALHSVTPGRIHQILGRAERDRRDRRLEQLPSLESIKADAMRKPIPPWLREDQVNEPNHDQRS